MWSQSFIVSVSVTMEEGLSLFFVQIQHGNSEERCRGVTGNKEPRDGAVYDVGICGIC